MEGTPQRAGILVLAMWLHGDELVGRITSIQDVTAPSSPVQICTSVDGICDALRRIVERFRDAAVTAP